MPTITTTKTPSVPKPEPKNTWEENHEAIEVLIENIKKPKPKKVKTEVRDEGFEKLKKMFNI